MALMRERRYAQSRSHLRHVRSRSVPGHVHGVHQPTNALVQSRQVARGSSMAMFLYRQAPQSAQRRPEQAGPHACKEQSHQPRLVCREEGSRLHGSYDSWALAFFRRSMKLPSFSSSNSRSPPQSQVGSTPGMLSTDSPQTSCRRFTGTLKCCVITSSLSLMTRPASNELHSGTIERVVG